MNLPETSSESEPPGFIRVGFTAFHFVLRFDGVQVPGCDDGAVFEVMVSPPVAQAFAKALAESLADYETRFGKIPELPK